jgi:acetyl esterase/lipase
MLRVRYLGSVLAIPLILSPLPAAEARMFLDPQFPVKVTTGVVYGTGLVQSPAPGEKPLLLDLYEPVLPASTTFERLPAVVIVHGGAFDFGDKSDWVGGGNYDATRGYVAVSINYRMFADNPPDVPTFDTGGLRSGILEGWIGLFPTGFLTDPMTQTGQSGEENLQQLLRAAAAAAADTARAVAWLRENADGLRVDPSRIALGGDSAGAIAALLVAYDESMGPASRVGLVYDWCGALYGNESLIGPGEPPLFIIHGNADDVIPVSWAEDLRAAAVAAGIPYEAAIVPGVGHCPNGSEVVDGRSVLDRLMLFIFEHLDLEELIYLARDCDENGITDVDEIASGTQSDIDLDGIPDNCEPDCNQNGVPDDCDLVDGTSPDCNSNGIPDECDIASGHAYDCDGSGTLDECEASRFPARLSGNTTGIDDSRFLGPPDKVYEGIQGSIEFTRIDVLVSVNGVSFTSVKASERGAVRIPGDEALSSAFRARSYDLEGSGLASARYIRIDGLGDEAAGEGRGFDLDAVGCHHLALCLPPALPELRRGDSNADGTPDISDAVAILGFLFLGSTMNDCEDAADVNDDGKVDISDPVRLIGFLFLGSERPPDPFTACSVDSTEDELDCKTFDECP